MSILENINQLIQESQIFSDKTISIDLDKFESGRVNKLFIVGLSGAGKTTLGIHLGKVYDCEFYDTDNIHWQLKGIPKGEEFHKLWEEKTKERFNLPIRQVIGGVGIDAAFRTFKKGPMRDIVMKTPIIFIGKSVLMSSIDASIRDMPWNPEKSRIKKFIHRLPKNIKHNKPLEDFKKARIKAGGKVKEFKVPELEKNAHNVPEDELDDNFE
jgi:hypothetical protein